MKTRYFIAIILLGMLLEYLFRLAFLDYQVLIVPELIIFLTILNLKNEDILSKFVYSTIMYDIWASSYFGVIIIAMLITFLVLYFVGRVSFISDNKIRKDRFINVITLIIFSDFLFLIYYASSHFLVGAISQGWILVLPTLTDIVQISVTASAIFLIFYSFNKFLNKPRSFKL